MKKRNKQFCFSLRMRNNVTRVLMLKKETRNKRTKRSKKNLCDTLTFYKQQLGFKEPFTVILDASMFRYLASLVELEGCLHGKEISGAMCIRSLVGIYNSNKMFVATRMNSVWPLIKDNRLIPIITGDDGGLVLKELCRDERQRAKNWCPTSPIKKPAFTDTELNDFPDYQRLLERFTFYGFDGVISVNDIESQFKAISEQLGPSKWPYKAVKGFVVDQLLLYAERYKECHLDYIVQVSRDGQWGDDVTLQAAADFFGVEIFVVNSSKERVPLSRCAPYGVEHPKKAIYLSCLTIGDEMHYNSVHLQPNGSFPSTCSHNYM